MRCILPGYITLNEYEKEWNEQQNGGYDIEEALYLRSSIFRSNSRVQFIIYARNKDGNNNSNTANSEAA